VSNAGRKVLVIGSGAREHALVGSLVRSQHVSEVLCAPGNAGIAELARCVEIASSDLDALVQLARGENVALAVVGPEAPLVAGLADRLREAGIATLGPDREAARLEGSKAFAKDVMRCAGVPTAGFAVFDDADAAEAYIRAANRPLVVKADGLAAGKGVVVAADTAEALAAIRSMMRERVFGAAGGRVVVEEQLRGPEVSYHIVSDGERFVPLAAAQDHKRLQDGDRGPNTGGMGAYSPPAPMSEALRVRIDQGVVEPTLAEMRRRGTPFRGVLFVGLMIVEGDPFVLEYNVRFGDPETTVVLPRYAGDVYELLSAVATGDLSQVNAAPALGGCQLAVVLAAEGYPEAPRRGAEIRGLDSARAVDGVSVFHAGTALEGEALRVAGGRVLTISAGGRDADEAAERAYRAAAAISFDGMQLRLDIGWQARSMRSS
jgi:phosphoribosylamine---glycine ligase